MLRKGSARVGWVLVIAAVVIGVLTVPILEPTAFGTDGAFSGQSGPFGTVVTGTLGSGGTFTYTQFWSVSWPALLLCTGALALGAFLIVREYAGRRGSPVQPTVASPS
jgi:hypothetical protein